MFLIMSWESKIQQRGRGRSEKFNSEPHDILHFKGDELTGTARFDKRGKQIWFTNVNLSYKDI